LSVFSRHERTKTKATPLAFKSILVPVNGSEASLMAVEFACSIAKRTRGKVHVVHVIEVRRALPLDADLTIEAQRGEEILGQAESEAIERQADAIFVGVPYRRPFGEFDIGRVPAQILKTATCEVIVLRMPAD
jgi:nucleotide-binding universal stress UspA family protein